MGVSDDGLTGTSGPNNATMSSTNQPPSRSESKKEKERCEKNDYLHFLFEIEMMLIVILKLEKVFFSFDAGWC